MYWSPVLPMRTALEGGEAGELDAGIGGGGAKRLGQGRSEGAQNLLFGAYRTRKLAHKSL